MERNLIKIDIFSDITCPWCLIGFKNLQKAISTLEEHNKFEINWLAFELHPFIPSSGLNKKDFMKSNLRDLKEIKETSKYLIELGKAIGFTFHFSNNNPIPNTFHAHRLVWYLKSMKLQSKLVEALFFSYFTQGINISDKENLIKIAKSIGLEENEIRDFLSSKQGEQEIANQEEMAKEKNIFGVPTYIFNDRYILPGGQESDTFISFLKRINEKELNN